MQGVEDIEVIGSASNSSQHGYTPQVKNEFVPKIGQHFHNLDEVHSFYNNYGREGGFGTRLNSSKKSTDGEIIRKEYVCYKEGVRKLKINKTAHTVRRRGLTREGCGARLVVVKDRSDAGGFLVRQFVEGHNHPLTTPRKVHLLHSHRAVTVAKRNLTQQLSNANVPTWQQMSLLEMDAGGLQNVGCTLRDLYNAERDRRKALKGHDANLLFEHFKDEQKKNPGFTFAFEQDEGVMVHCFWADATCRKAYKYFGDVVVFDTTYNTNRYKLIFAPMVGVNHHGQTTLLGCAFLSGEKIDAFDWFFKQWLKAMPGGPPKMIITDQDPAIGNAIRTVLPNTFHRYCIWHILTKFSEKISAISYKEHYDEFSKCIWKSERPEEFEGRWAEVVAKLDNNEWLNSMYQIRERWVPVYSRHIFSAHMTSSQRVEGAHAFFKKYVSHQNSMLDFVTRFNRGLSKKRHNELDADHKDVNEKPQTVTGRVMETQMSELYTVTIFNKFQEQLVESGKYVVKSTFKHDHLCVYNVRRVTETDSKGRELTLEKSSNFVKCSCKMFESDGIPCRHMLAYFSKKQIMELPEQYILRRWTKAAKAGRVMDDLGGTVNEICDTSLIVRRNSLFQLPSNVIDEAVLSEDDTEELKQILLEAQRRFVANKRGKDGVGEKVGGNRGTEDVGGNRGTEDVGGNRGTEDVGGNRGTEDVGGNRGTEVVQRKRGIENVEGSHATVEDMEGQGGSVNMPFSLESQHNLKEPFPVRTKGCGKRLKGGKEKAVKKKKKKGRRCNGCGLMNQTHGKRNCPKLLGIKSQSVRLNDEEDLNEDDEDDEEVDEEEEDIDFDSDFPVAQNIVVPEHCDGTVVCYCCNSGHDTVCFH